MNHKIEVFDDFIPYDRMERIYDFCHNSSFKLGWADGNSDEKRKLKNLHSPWSFDDLDRSQLLQYIGPVLQKSKNFNHLSVDDIYLTACNLCTPADTFFAHTHADTDTLLYYPNLHWEDGWEGETRFLDKNNRDEIIYTTIYKPGRIILFDGEIPHIIGTQSISGPKYRFTVGVFFKRK
jgi:hypothetical protein